MTETIATPSVLASTHGIAKAPTGISGLDDVTHGGLPRGRTTLVAGAAGSGKSMLAVEFLARGARDFDEPGVLITFEESAAKISANVASLGFDLEALQREGKLVVQGFVLDPAEIVETGSFDLDGLLLYLASAVDRVRARRVVLDTLEVLLTAFNDVATIRGELGRLFRWLDERGLTAVVTGERGQQAVTRYGIEEYVSDCVILLDHRVTEEHSTRRLRIVKYRGSLHGTNEYPFLITGSGMVVQPLSAAGLAYPASSERMSTGVERLDRMLGGGIYRGSTVLVSGSAGTGKTSLAARLAAAACERGETVLYVLYEESPEQHIRNMRSVGIDLSHWSDAGLLSFFAARPAAYDLERHLVGLIDKLDAVRPAVTILDALTGFQNVASQREVAALITRMVAEMKSRGVTAVLTSLAQEESEQSEIGVSSLIDTWLLLRNIESDGERNRLLFIIKSRGSSHSNQVREFILSDQGPDLLDVYLGPEGILVGSARARREATDRRARQRRDAELTQRRRDLRRRTVEIETQTSALRDTLADSQQELQLLVDEVEARESAEESGLAARRHQRWSDPEANGGEQP